MDVPSDGRLREAPRIPVHHDGTVTVVAPTGVYGVNELQARVQEVLADAAGPVHLLFDLRESLSLANRTTAEIRGMAAFVRSIARQLGPRFAIVTSNELGYGLMRMGSAFAQDDGLSVSVFQDVPGALAWLREPS